MTIEPYSRRASFGCSFSAASSLVFDKLGISQESKVALTVNRMSALLVRLHAAGSNNLSGYTLMSRLSRTIKVMINFP